MFSAGEAEELIPEKTLRISSFCYLSPFFSLRFPLRLDAGNAPS
jgi:hypothetical protein